MFQGVCLPRPRFSGCIAHCLQHRYPACPESYERGDFVMKCEVYFPVRTVMPPFCKHIFAQIWGGRSAGVAQDVPLPLRCVAVYHLRMQRRAWHLQRKRLTLVARIAFNVYYKRVHRIPLGQTRQHSLGSLYTMCSFSVKLFKT